MDTSQRARILTRAAGQCEGHAAFPTCGVPRHDAHPVGGPVEICPADTLGAVPTGNDADYITLCAEAARRRHGKIRRARALLRKKAAAFPSLKGTVLYQKLCG